MWFVESRSYPVSNILILLLVGVISPYNLFANVHNYNHYMSTKAMWLFSLLSCKETLCTKGTDLTSILTDSLNKHWRCRLLGGGGGEVQGLLPWEVFWILTPLNPTSFPGFSNPGNEVALNPPFLGFWVIETEYWSVPFSLVEALQIQPKMYKKKHLSKPFSSFQLLLKQYIYFEKKKLYRFHL